MLLEVAQQDLNSKLDSLTMQGCVLSCSSAFHPLPHREQTGPRNLTPSSHLNPHNTVREAVLILI